MDNHNLEKAKAVYMQRQFANMWFSTPQYSETFELYKAFTFGRWTQNFNEISDIIWITIAREENRALAIAEYALHAMPYSSSNSEPSWRFSPIRKWLNTDFLDGAFSQEERDRIIPTAIKTGDGNNTTDSIFLLSGNQANQLCDKDTLETLATVNAIYFGCPTEEDGSCCWWWLLDQSQSVAGNVAVVSPKGYIRENGQDITNVLGVRPAIWIDTRNKISESDYEKRNYTSYLNSISSVIGHR